MERAWRLGTLALGAFALGALALLSGGCSNGSSGGGGDGGGCTAYVVPSGTDLTSPTSFKTDIMPIFQLSCALSASCHGATTGSNNGVQLGVVGMPGDPAAVYPAIVGVPSKELSTMNFVKAGDPANSYLMHKMDGDQCLYESKCTNPFTTTPACGVSMPNGSPLLDVPTRDKMRRWIKEGAQNN